MKKLFLIFALMPVLTFAQYKIGAVKAGLYSPSATESGFIIGYEGDWEVDDNFMVGFSVDWFNKNYVDRRLVTEFNNFFGPINSELNELRAKTNLHSIPLMFTINAGRPIAPRARAYFTASAGLDVLLIFYRNYENPEDDEFQGAFDFAWRLGGGVSYEIGKHSDVFGELAYHGSKPSWEYEVKDRVTGKTKIFERRFDMTGIMLRLGFRFYF
jgi:hypothetical protein